MAPLPATTLGTDPGLRERKKQRTRELIAETARRLFSQRAFEAVTVAEIAEAAEVSEQTVFNHFPTKEDLVYWRLESFEEELLNAIRERPPGQTIAAAFGEFVLRPRGALAAKDPEAIENLRAITRMIASSPALLAREQQIYAGYTDSLAALIAAERGSGRGSSELEPWVVAHALMGVHQAMVSYARRRIVAGAKNPKLAREVRREGELGLAALERGLAEFLPGRSEPARPGVTGSQKTGRSR
jgi:AcrR family transcriptional regulator